MFRNSRNFKICNKNYYRVRQFNAFNVMFWQLNEFVIAFPVHGRNQLLGVNINVEQTVYSILGVKLLVPFTFEVHCVGKHKRSIRSEIV